MGKAWHAEPLQNLVSMSFHFRSAINLMKWRCHVPGKPKTDWEGGYFPLTIEFSEDYPSKPPKVT